MAIFRLQILIVAAIIACEGEGKEIINHYVNFTFNILVTDEK